jgi:hypothetical protein
MAGIVVTWRRLTSHTLFTVAQKGSKDLFRNSNRIKGVKGGMIGNQRGGGSNPLSARVAGSFRVPRR